MYAMLKYFEKLLTAVLIYCLLVSLSRSDSSTKTNQVRDQERALNSARLTVISCKRRRCRIVTALSSCH